MELQILIALEFKIQRCTNKNCLLCWPLYSKRT